MKAIMKTLKEQVEEIKAGRGIFEVLSYDNKLIVVNLAY